MADSLFWIFFCLPLVLGVELSNLASGIQERMNELQIYSTDDPLDLQGYRTILAAPAHAPYRHFIPAPGHGLGFNELKVIECHELLQAISGSRDTHVINFERGLEIERVVHAAAKSADNRMWVEL